MVAALAAIAAWLSQSTLAFTSSGGARIGLLPLSPQAIVLSGVAAAAVGLMAWRANAVTPALLLVLVLIPWMPVGIPPALLIWSGPLVLLVWIALFAILAGSPPPSMPSVARRIAARPAVAAGVMAGVLCATAAWHVSPSIPGGDEPHYLVITQSLLFDHDLRIENNHRNGDYHAYFAGELRPDFLRRGRDGQIYSVHAPGLPTLVLPAFAIGGYRGVVAFLIILSSFTAGLAWRLARRVTGRADAAWFGWAALVFAPTTVLNAFTVYPDGAGALLVLTGVWALIRARDEHVSGVTSVRPWLLHGAALALLPWLHTRFALLAGGLGALVLLHLARTKNPAAKASAFLVLPAVSAMAWVGFFMAVYGAPDPAIPYRGSDLGSPSYIAEGFMGLLFDQQFGLLAYAPVLVAALGGLVALGRKPNEFRWLPAEVVFVGAPYVLTVTHFAMWWGGLSAPARFLLPLLPSLAIFAAAAWAAASRRGTRAVMMASLFVTAFISGALVLVDGGAFAYHGRELYAGWLQWLARLTDLQHALPSFFSRLRVTGRARSVGGLFYAEIAVWVLSLGAAWLLVRAIDGRPSFRRRSDLASATAGVLAVAVMLTVAAVWRIEKTSGLTPAPAQLEFLRDAGAASRFVAVDLSGTRRLRVGDFPQDLVIEAPAAAPGPAPFRDDRPLFALPGIPAGEYRLSVEGRAGRDGWLMVGIGRDQFAILTQPAAAFDPGPRVRFPVDVRAIVVRGDEEARRAGGVLRLRPISVLKPAEKASPARAIHAVRYGASTVFFMDDRSFPEPSAFWVGGGRQSSVVLQPDTARSSGVALLRNAPVDNAVELQAGNWKSSLRLAPGEERLVSLPLDIARGATLISFQVASGFRPSAVNPDSRDERFLGISVKLE